MKKREEIRSESSESGQDQEKKSEAEQKELDFSLAFADIEKRPEESLETGKDGFSEILETGLYIVPSTMVRIQLRKNVSNAIVYYIDSVDVCAGNYKERIRGRIPFKIKGDGSVYIGLNGKNNYSAALPCTLLAVSKQNFFEFDGKSYRGSVILSKGYGSGFSLINYLSVESYLRGVVALEIGKRPMEEIEAVKAQAVAARTYTYKRMENRREKEFDLVPTVADQVYGGVSAESPVSDIAVRATDSRVVTFKEELVHAYYHSTCGGKTANIKDVWQKDPQPYLRSVEDTDKNGKPYCSISRYFRWREKWSISQFSRIAASYSRTAFPGQVSLKGNIKDLNVIDRFECGRISKIRFSTTQGKYFFGTDKIRFMLRRNVSGSPILRSANFEVEKLDDREVVLKGAGYGHGVGMCQMGAVGRARAGQSYEEILGAYYRGTDLTDIKISD